MTRAVVIKGHLVGPNSVELEEPVEAGAYEVEVIVRMTEPPSVRPDGLADFLRSLPPGSRSKDDIDRQVRAERDAWS